jgi:trans-AT polyketide synthase, acyltransferase and oxidoreductase domains
MAPSADMFEMGIRVQVLKRGTFFATRAARLYELYSTHRSLEAIPPGDRARLEEEIFRMPLEQAWAETRRFWEQRDPHEVEKANKDPKHQMALVFRSYLGLASQWAVAGRADRAADFQIWCGPAMGAFNDWVAGSFLEDPANRSVVQVALNLLEGAAVVTRAQQLRTFGLAIPTAAFSFAPRPLELAPSTIHTAAAAG